MQQQRPYGAWPSPLRPEHLAQDLRFGAAMLSPDGSRVAWLESRDDQGLVKLRHVADDADRELTRGFRVRAGVGYGGGDFTVDDHRLLFLDQRQGRMVSLELEGQTETVPSLLGPAAGRAAAPTLSPDGRWVCYVHQDADDVDRLLVSPCRGHAWPLVVHEGHDFYMQARWSPDGRYLAFVAWDHPQMPWDGCTLYLAEIAWRSDPSDLRADGGNSPRILRVRALAGGDDVAVFQPEFSPDGSSLYFVSDETGWGQVVRLDLATGQRVRLTSGEAEHGQPAWVQDMRSYALAEGGRALYVVRSEMGFRRLYRIDLVDGSMSRVAALAAYDEVHTLHADRAGTRLALVASAARQPPRVLLLDLGEGRLKVLARASAETFGDTALAQPEVIAWSARDGARLSGLYYPPTSRDYRASGAPPVVLMIHGGPTAQSTAGWNPACQFLATRGYGVFALNYRGSHGFGRTFMKSLDAAWGEADVADAAAAAQHLVALGKADPARVAIMGGSAGGYTVLRAMTTLPDQFAAGISMYGISDLLQLAQATHKFEAHYLDRLVGPLPEQRARYVARSPLSGVDAIRRPLALFQGADDRAVPRAQADLMAESLAKAGLKFLYQVYEGEGHGWRKAETIGHFWAAVEAFLAEHLAPTAGMTPAQG